MNNTKKTNITLIITTIGSFLTPFMGSAINVALPAIGREFNLNAVTLSWVPTSYLLAAAISLVPIGRIADITSRPRIFLYGVITFGGFSFIGGLSNNAVLFMACRVIQGLGGAMIFGTAVAILTSVFPAQQRGKALGINVAGVYLGLSLGPFLGGFLTQHFGWRSIFYTNTLLSIIMLILILGILGLKEEKQIPAHFDYLGTLIYSPSLFFLMYGFSLLPGISGAFMILAGVVLTILFIRIELTNPYPLFDVGLFRLNPAFFYSNLAALINYSATNAVTFLLSLYLQYVKSYSPQGAGAILIAQPVTMTLLSPLAGRLSDRIQPAVIASLGMGITALGLFLLNFINNNTPINIIILCLIILGFGFALFSSPNTNAVMSSVAKEYYGIASSTLATMRLLGQMTSMAIVMLIFSTLMGRIKITPEVYPLYLKSTKVCLVFFTVLCVVGILASLKRGRINKS